MGIICVRSDFWGWDVSLWLLVARKQKTSCVVALEDGKTEAMQRQRSGRALLLAALAMGAPLPD